nr:MAG TPA: hypothetical protein [Caudoviricetes sp.]
MTIVGWSPEDDKINTTTAVEPAGDKKDNKDKEDKKQNKGKKNTSKGKAKEAVEPAEIEPIIEE